MSNNSGNNKGEDTTQILRSHSGAISADDRMQRIETSLEKIVDKLDDFVRRFEEVGKIEIRLTNIERVVYAGAGLILASFITGVVTLIWKHQA